MVLYILMYFPPIFFSSVFVTILWSVYSKRLLSLALCIHFQTPEASLLVSTWGQALSRLMVEGVAQQEQAEHPAASSSSITGVETSEVPSTRWISGEPQACCASWRARGGGRCGSGSVEHTARQEEARKGWGSGALQRGGVGSVHGAMWTIGEL